jgi:hypothetical protein
MTHSVQASCRPTTHQLLLDGLIEALVDIRPNLLFLPAFDRAYVVTKSTALTIARTRASAMVEPACLTSAFASVGIPNRHVIVRDLATAAVDPRLSVALTDTRLIDRVVAALDGLMTEHHLS